MHLLQVVNVIFRLKEQTSEYFGGLFFYTNCNKKRALFRALLKFFKITKTICFRIFF